MKIKTQDLIGAALDWAVAKASQPVYSDTALVVAVRGGYDGIGNFHEPFSPSTNWAQGGPIVERENIDVFTEKGTPESWFASVSRHQNGERLYGWRIHKYGPTPLVAAMRCYVASKLGDEVDVPDELTKENQP